MRISPPWIKLFYAGVILSFLSGCKKPENNIHEVNLSMQAQTVKETVESDSSYVPTLDSIPCILILRQKQLSSFVKWFYGYGESKWINMKSEFVDSAFKLTFTMKPPFTFIQSLKGPGALRYQEYINDPRWTLNCITDPDSLAANKIPMVKPDFAKRYFNVPDSVYLIYSYAHYFEAHRNTSQNLTCHIFYNYHQKTFVLMTLDTLLQKKDETLLFTQKDSNTSYTFKTPLPSSLQLFRHTRSYNPKSGYTKIDNKEFKRFFIDSTGAIYDWTDTLLSSEQFCFPLPIDSSFDYDSYGIKTRAVPLPLHFEEKIKRQIKLTYDSPNLDLSNHTNFDQTLFYYEYRLSSSSAFCQYAVGNKSISTDIIILSDCTENIYDAKEIITQTPGEYDNWYPANGRLAANSSIYIIDKFQDRDTLSTWTIRDKKLLSTGLKPKMLTFPVRNPDAYFPVSNVRSYEIGNIQKIFIDSIPDNHFPDSLYQCIADVARTNGGYFTGKPYQIIHASNGLTYLLLLQDGDLENVLNLFIVDRDNVLRLGSHPLSYSGGDGGDIWYRSGYFINDSTYHATSVSRDYYSGQDSTITVYSILPSGQIIMDDSRSEYYTRPYLEQ